MQFVSIKGAQMPALRSFGTWRLQDEGVRACRCSEALDIGYRHIDTAQMYNNEAQVGSGIVASGIARKEIVRPPPKIWITHLGAGQVAPSVEESLSKLRMDYVGPAADPLAGVSRMKRYRWRKRSTPCSSW